MATHMQCPFLKQFDIFMVRIFKQSISSFVKYSDFSKPLRYLALNMLSANLIERPFSSTSVHHTIKYQTPYVQVFQKPVSQHPQIYLRVCCRKIVIKSTQYCIQYCIAYSFCHFCNIVFCSCPANTKQKPILLQDK